MSTLVTDKPKISKAVRDKVKSYFIANELRKKAERVEKAERQSLLQACIDAGVKSEELGFVIDDKRTTVQVAVAQSKKSVVVSSRAIEAIGQKEFNRLATVTQAALKSAGVDANVIQTMTEQQDGSLNVTVTTAH